MLELAPRFDAATIEAARQARDSRAARGSAGVAVIPIAGPLEAKPSFLSWLFGALSYEEIREAARSAMADPDVSGVILDIDSPGGTAFGLPELARDIRALRGTKPIVAVANAEAASAAYYLGSQADEFVVTPSGQVGSIGTVYLHTDLTGMAEREGVKFTIIRNPEKKFEGSPYEALSEDARADIQAKIDQYTGMFHRDVALGRGVTAEQVAATFGQGRMLMAQDALAAGMVDRIETLAETVARVMGGQVPARAAASPKGEAPVTPAPAMESSDELAAREARTARLWEIALTRA